MKAEESSKLNKDEVATEVEADDEQSISEGDKLRKIPRVKTDNKDGAVVSSHVDLVKDRMIESKAGIAQNNAKVDESDKRHIKLNTSTTRCTNEDQSKDQLSRAADGNESTATTDSSGQIASGHRGISQNTLHSQEPNDKASQSEMTNVESHKTVDPIPNTQTGSRSSISNVSSVISKDLEQKQSDQQNKHEQVCTSSEAVSQVIRRKHSEAEKKGQNAPKKTNTDSNLTKQRSSKDVTAMFSTNYGTQRRSSDKYSDTDTSEMQDSLTRRSYSVGRRRSVRNKQDPTNGHSKPASQRSNKGLTKSLSTYGRKNVMTSLKNKSKGNSVDTHPVEERQAEGKTDRISKPFVAFGETKSNS